MLIAARITTALMIMPGIGDTFVPQNIRIFIGMGLSLILTPLIIPSLPDPLPGGVALAVLLASEFLIGIFAGTVARILMSAFDTAGMVISLSSGLGNAQIFNPGFGSQGSLIGAFLSVTGMVLLFATNMHHLLLRGLTESYALFPAGSLPDTGSMAEMITRAVAVAFLTGIQIAAPFIAAGLLVQIGMGILARLMPQVQVFLLALPMQILLSFLTLLLTVSAGMLFFLSKFEEGMVFFLSGG